MSFPPFWIGHPSQVHEVEDVKFQSTVINPIVGTKDLDRYPLVIWFCGLGPSGFDGIGVELAWLSRATSKPFVLVAPIRRYTTWWVLDVKQHPWGCVMGSLMSNQVGMYCRWIGTLARTPGIDSNSVSLYGGSAGAYAVSEIIAHGSFTLRCVGLAALHGHGRPDLDGLDDERKIHSKEIKDKWMAYINRIKEHRTTTKFLIGVHKEEDIFCPWKYAQDIYAAFDHRRKSQQCSPSTQVLVHVQSTNKHSSDNYSPQAMEFFLKFAVGDAELSETVWHLPLTKDNAILVSLSEQSRERDRSRSPLQGRGQQCDVGTEHPKPAPHVVQEIVHMKANDVWQDGALPGNHIGSITLSSGMRGLYIVHCKTNSELFSNAKNIVNSGPLKNLKYFDHGEKSSICDSVESALATEKNLSEGRCFMYATVINVVAIGIGGNIKDRGRAARIAAAVCSQLQAKKPNQELLKYYPELFKLMKQVRCRCNFEVR